ncbi:hypothetical protein SNE40_013526 [Patella caerulea]|uniref:F-box domain-containing protein n=1 Tax=Patella caerulea TaxID=87958 RepID=A0AAN8JIE9_PATCE
MAPNWPEEVDVFSVPHSRMKELVQGYLDQMTSTNFSNVIHLTTLLKHLCDTFREFKVHEQIENKYILCKLRQKLRSLSIRNSAVCNCHSDNRLTEMLELVEDGFDWTWRPQADRMHYGFKLRRALEDFTQTFIPHMEEEEAVFQPMLIEYFSYDELKAIKAEVIHQHLTNGSENYQEEKFVEDTKSREVSEDEEDDVKSSLDRLPDEVLLLLFKYLSPVDLCRCSRVSRRFNHLALDSSLWTQLYPVQWVKGIWSVDEVYDNESDYDKDVHDTYIVIDEDADIDESPGSELSSGGDDNVRQVKREVKVLLSIVKYLLPRVGSAVKIFNLAYSQGISNGMVKRILKLCPNLEHLNLRQTRVTDGAFKILGQTKCGQKLRHIDLSGCDGITDGTLRKISQIFTDATNVKQNKILAKTLQNCVGTRDNVSAIPELVNQVTCSQCGRKNVSDSINDKLASSEKLLSVDTTVSILQDCLFENYSRCDQSTGLSELQIEFDQLVSLVKGGNSDPYQTQTKIDFSMTTEQEVPSSTTTVNGSNVSSDTDDTSEIPAISQLEYLNLSGCHRLTDTGIGYLIKMERLPWLRYLDLSGCFNMTGSVIRQLVSICPVLDHSQLYYCDNLTEDPFPQTASGCLNVDCQSRYCCRK